MRRGFTITELLVVIFIMTMLTGLSVLALSGMRNTGRSTRCLGNLRQMALAATAYALEFDHFPASIRYERHDDVFRNVSWDWVTTFDGAVISPGSIWDYSGNPDEIHQCPEYDGPDNAPGDPFTGYNYNTTYLGGEASFPLLGWNQYRLGIPYSQCTRTSTCAMFGDGGWIGGANKFMRAPENSEGQSWSVVYGGGQSFRHRGSTNVAYLDGHVARVSAPKPGVQATDDLLFRIMGFPKNGFLSDDDSAYRPR